MHPGEPASHCKASADSRNGGVPDVQLVGESILYAVFKKGSSLTNEQASKLESMLFSILRDYDRGVQTNSPGSRVITALDVAVEMYSQLVSSYSQLLVSVVPPKELGHYFSSPENFSKDREAEVPEYVRRKLSLLTLSHSNSWNLSKAMTKLFRTAAAADIHNKQIV